MATSPAPVTIEKLAPQALDRFTELVRLFEVVFEMENFIMPPTNHLAGLLQQPNFFAFVALKEGHVVGGLTAYVLHQYYAVRPLAYIYDLAVDTALQRQGIGRQLIAATNAYCRSQGFEEVFVQADKADGHALDFYRSTQPTEEEDVSHFYYTL